MNNLWGSLQPAFERAWSQHTLHAWFPRSLDTRWGGFLCDFDQNWSNRGPNDKLLEFQSRQLMLASEGWLQFPHDPLLRQAAQHGYQYLAEVMWDAQEGGWYHRLDQQGRVLENGTKHAHGIAYAIQACVTYGLASQTKEPLDFAFTGFEWLNLHAFDRQHGGYFGMLSRRGTPVLEPGQDWTKPQDTIGTTLGYKDLNVHSDLLEALLCLQQARPTAEVAERALGLVDLILTRALAPNFAIHFFHSRDWRPVPHVTQTGNAFQTVCRLLWSRALWPDPHQLESAALGIFDFLHQHARDGRGGYASAGVSLHPYDLESHRFVCGVRSWWVQAEGLRALLLLDELQPQQEAFRTEFQKLWRTLEGCFFDVRRGGSKYQCLGDLPLLQRLWLVLRGRSKHGWKGNPWKDGSHDGRALLHCLRAAAGIPSSRWPLCPPSPASG